MSSWNREDAIKCQVDLMENEILYLQGRSIKNAKEMYLKLLHSCSTACALDKSIYFVRM